MQPARGSDPRVRAVDRAADAPANRKGPPSRGAGQVCRRPPGVSCPHAPCLNLLTLRRSSCPECDGARPGSSGRDGHPETVPVTAVRRNSCSPPPRPTTSPRSASPCSAAFSPTAPPRCARKPTRPSATPTRRPTASGSSTGSAATTCRWPPRSPRSARRWSATTRVSSTPRSACSAARSSPSAPKACCTSPRPAGTPTTASACAASSSLSTSTNSPPVTGRCGWCRARTSRSRTRGWPPTATVSCPSAPTPRPPPTRRASPDTWPPPPRVM